MMETEKLNGLWFKTSSDISQKHLQAFHITVDFFDDRLQNCLNSSFDEIIKMLQHIMKHRKHFKYSLGNAFLTS